MVIGMAMVCNAIYDNDFDKQITTPNEMEKHFFSTF